MRLAQLSGVLALCACGSTYSGPEYLRHHIDDIPDAGCVAWVDRHYTYHVDPSTPPQDPKHAALAAAAASWQTVSNGCSDFVITEGAQDAGSQQNVIVFRAKNCSDIAPPNDPCNADGTCANTYGCWDQDPTVLGLDDAATYTTSTGAR